MFLRERGGGRAVDAPMHTMHACGLDFSAFNFLHSLGKVSAKILKYFSR